MGPEMQNVLLERDGALAVVTVNRPAKLNALDGQTITELRACFAALDRDEGQLASVYAGKTGVRTFPVDVTDLEAVCAIVDTVERELGPIDRVVHAAGIMPGSPLLIDDPDRIKRVMRVNYDGTVNLVHATLKRLVDRKRGELVCFGSVAGEALTPRLGAYCASKAAVNAFMEILAHENAGSGVTIHLVCPPMVGADERDRLAAAAGRAIDEGSEVVVDGRDRTNEAGALMGPTILTIDDRESDLAREELFGPLLGLLEVESLDEALEFVNSSRYGNASVIFTSSGEAVRRYRNEVEAGMVGVNIGVPAPVAWFPFAGWKDSMVGDLHANGHDAIDFYTRKKVLTTRW